MTSFSSVTALHIAVICGHGVISLWCFCSDVSSTLFSPPPKFFLHPPPSSLCSSLLPHSFTLRPSFLPPSSPPPVYSVDFVKWSSQGMLRMNPDAMNSLFKPTIDHIIQHLSELKLHLYVVVPHLQTVSYDLVNIHSIL